MSYLTPWTGISNAAQLENGISLDEAIKLLKSKLPSDSILNGQRIGGDIEWMKLQKGYDFQDFIDLAEVFKSWHPKYKKFK